MSSLPPKPDFDDDRRSSPRRTERPDHDRRASSSRGPPPLADSYIAPAGDTYVPRHDERSRRTSPPPRPWRDPPRRSPPPRRDEWRQRDELIDRRRDYPPRSRDYPRAGPRDRDWRRDRDYDDRDRPYSRRSPSPHDRDRRRASRGSPSPPRRSAYDYRRRSPPHYPRRSASPPRYRRSSPGKREDGRFSPRRPPPRDDDREGRPTRRRSRSQTRSRTPRSPGPQAGAQTTELTSRSPVPAEKAPKPPSPHGQKPLDQPSETPEVDPQQISTPAEVVPEPTVDTDVTMADVHPPTRQRPSGASAVAPPTQPKNFGRPPPTGPRLIPTTPGQLHPSHRQSMPETSSAPVPVQDLSPAVADAPVEEEPEIQLPTIPKYELPGAKRPDGGNKNSGDKDNGEKKKTIENTIDELMRRSYIMRADYGEVLKAARKAMHEQEMAEIELTAARMRREVADSQLEKSRVGQLGIDYDGISGLVINE